jgi:hypothetical protein
MIQRQHTLPLVDEDPDQDALKPECMMPFSKWRERPGAYPDKDGGILGEE